MISFWKCFAQTYCIFTICLAECYQNR